VSRLHIADTGLFVAMGQPSNSRYQAVRRFARRTDVTFVLPERVYEELTVTIRMSQTRPSMPVLRPACIHRGSPLLACRWRHVLTTRR
jgi:hypothetical protein